MCSCIKSGCLRKYCECWANGKICDLNCKCINCNNKPNNIKRIEALKKYKPKVFDSCACVRSKCLKKYCECFALGKKCKEECKCLDCHNKSDELLNNNSSGFTTPVKTNKKRKNYEVSTPPRIINKTKKTQRFRSNSIELLNNIFDDLTYKSNLQSDLFRFVDISFGEYMTNNKSKSPFDLD